MKTNSCKTAITRMKSFFVMFLLLFCLCPVLLFGSAFLIAYYDHDLWFLMIFAYLASIFLSVLYIVWMATNGKKETNKWGPSPKYYVDGQPEQPVTTV